MKNLTIKILKYGFLIIASTLIISTANAEEKASESSDEIENFSDTSDEENSSSNTNNNNVDLKNVEKIKVTGSRIKRIDLEGPSPVTVFTSEDLENSGYSSAGDFLRDTTVAHFGVSREHAGSPGSGESGISLRGEKSLILLNGVRLVEDPHTLSVDLNMIPIYAIERIEVLKDGGSALYGADAIGGVVNFITKKNFSGVEFHAKVSPTFPDLNIKTSGKLSPWKWKLKGFPKSVGGTSLDLATVFGKSNNNLSYVGSLQLRGKRRVENFQREWTNSTISPISYHPIFKTKSDTSNNAIGCPEDLKTIQGCKFNVADFSTRLPGHSQLNGFFNLNYKFGESTFYVQFLGISKYVQWDYAPVPGALPIPEGHKMSYRTGQEGVLKYRFKEAGPRDTTYNSYILDSTIGVRGYLSKTWDYDLSSKLAYTRKNERQGGLLLKKELTESIITGLYDPFSEDNRDLSQAMYTAKAKNRSLLVFNSLDFSGETGFWGINLATGLQYYFKDFKNIADKKAKNREILSNAGSDGYGKRHVGSSYLELSKYFADILEVQLAGRADYYSDFGFTANPKLAFRFQPFSQFLIRGSVGRAFVAPGLSLLNIESSEGYPQINDKVACYNELQLIKADSNDKQKDLSEALKVEGMTDDLLKDFLVDQRGTYKKSKMKKDLKKLSSNLKETTYCKNNQYRSFLEGNKNLKETIAWVASIGTHVQFNDEHSATLDAYYIKKSGLPSFGLGSATNAELKLGAEAVEKQNIVIKRDDNKYKSLHDGGDFAVKTKLVNLGKTQKMGLDFSWKSDMTNIKLSSGNPYFENNLSYIFFSRSQGFPGLDSINVMGVFGAPKWRNISIIGWKNKKHNVSFSALVTAPMSKKVALLENLPWYGRLDLDYQYIMNEKLSFSTGWSNLLFSTPPFDPDDEQNKIDDDIFESKGPFVFAGVKYKL